MQGQVRQVGLEHIQIHLMRLELLHNLLLQLLHLRQQIEQIIWGEEGEVKITCSHDGRSRVLQCLRKQIERIRVDTVVAHLQSEHINMGIHTEELVHIVRELHSARSTGRQDIFAEAHALHIGIRQVQVQYTLHQVPFQRTVKREVCLYLFIISR